MSNTIWNDSNKLCSDKVLRVRVQLWESDFAEGCQASISCKNPSYWICTHWNEYALVPEANMHYVKVNRHHNGFLMIPQVWLSTLNSHPENSLWAKFSPQSEHAVSRSTNVCIQLYNFAYIDHPRPVIVSSFNFVPGQSYETIQLFFMYELRSNCIQLNSRSIL